MKKLLCFLLILCMSSVLLTSCLDEDLLGGFFGSKDNSEADGSNDKLTNDSADDPYTSVDGTKTPDLVKGEEITEDVWQKVTEYDYTNFTFEQIETEPDRVTKSIHQFSSPNMLVRYFTDGALTSIVGTFNIDGSVRDLSYNLREKLWSPTQLYHNVRVYPIDSMPCEFSDLVFDESNGEYSAQIEMDDVKTNVKFRFNDGNLTYANVEAEKDAEKRSMQLFFYDYGTTNVPIPNSKTVVLDSNNGDNIVIKPHPGVSGDENATFPKDEEASDPNGTTTKPYFPPSDKDDGFNNDKDDLPVYDADCDGIPDADFNGDGKIDADDFPESSGSSSGSSGDAFEKDETLNKDYLEEQLRHEAERYLKSIPQVKTGRELSDERWNSLKNDPPKNYTYATIMTSDGKEYTEITMLNDREFMRVEMVDSRITYKWCGRMEDGKIVGYEFNFSSGKWERVNSSLSSYYPIETAPFDLGDFTFDRKLRAYTMTMTEGDMSATLALYFDGKFLTRLDQTNGKDTMISYFYDYDHTKISFPSDDEIDKSVSSGPSYGYTDKVNPDGGDYVISGGNESNGTESTITNGSVTVVTRPGSTSDSNGNNYYYDYTVTVKPDGTVTSSAGVAPSDESSIATFDKIFGSEDTTVSYYSFLKNNS